MNHVQWVSGESLTNGMKGHRRRAERVYYMSARDGLQMDYRKECCH